LLSQVPPSLLFDPSVQMALFYVTPVTMSVLEAVLDRAHPHRAVTNYAGTGIDDPYGITSGPDGAFVVVTIDSRWAAIAADIVPLSGLTD
jgi:hypothetical protein